MTQDLSHKAEVPQLADPKAELDATVVLEIHLAQPQKIGNAMLIMHLNVMAMMEKLMESELEL